MPYRLIKGQFHLFYVSATRLVGSRPDGDSMWFKPDNWDHLEGLGGRDAEDNQGGFAQLRFEGIDALELHYKGSNHQKVPECVEARNRLLQLAGYTHVTYAPASGISTSVRTAAPHSIDGYILARNVDPFGRPVAFAFVGNTNRRSGDNYWLSPAWMGRSLNANLVTEGLAYPAYYTGLPYDLRDRLTEFVLDAWGSGSGLWLVERSQAYTKISASNIETFALWPKLYRRLFKYFDDGNSGIGQFQDWLRADANRNDEVWVISVAQHRRLADVVEMQSGRIAMTELPEDLVIVPR